jgi:hypothetical protein
MTPPDFKESSMYRRSHAPKGGCKPQLLRPLMTKLMDADAADAEATTHESVPGKVGKPPSIILTAKINLIQLQKQVRNVVKADFEFRNTTNGTRVITKSMADFETVKSHFSNNISYFSFFPISKKT